MNPFIKIIVTVAICSISVGCSLDTRPRAVPGAPILISGNESGFRDQVVQKAQLTAVEKAWPHLKKGMTIDQLNARFGLGFEKSPLKPHHSSIAVVGQYKMTFVWEHLDSWEILKGCSREAVSAAS